MAQRGDDEMGPPAEGLAAADAVRRVEAWVLDWLRALSAGESIPPLEMPRRTPENAEIVDGRVVLGPQIMRRTATVASFHTYFRHIAVLGECHRFVRSCAGSFDKSQLTRFSSAQEHLPHSNSCHKGNCSTS
jgi:hypothetical protein